MITNMTLSDLSKRNKNVYLQRELQENGHGSLIDNMSPTWRQPRCPLTGAQIHTEEYHSAIKRNKLLIHASTGKTFCLTLWKKPYIRVHSILFDLYEVLWKAKLIYNEKNHNSGCLCRKGVGLNWEGPEEGHDHHSLGWWSCSIIL